MCTVSEVESILGWIPDTTTMNAFLNKNAAEVDIAPASGKIINQRTSGPVNAHLSLLHIPINMFEYYGI